MDLMLILFIQILIMFFYIMIGWLSIKTKLMNRDGAIQLSKILLYFITPVVIINAFTQMTFSNENTVALLISMGLSVVSLGLSMMISRLAFNRNYKIERFGAAFSNAGFMGIPLVMAVIGSDGVFYISAFITLITVLQWTYGVYAITESKKVISFSKIIKNPVVISFFLGILLYGLNGVGFSMPLVLSDQFQIVSKMMGPIAMLILGTYVARLSIKDFFSEKVVYVASGFRLIIIPLITLFLFILVPEKYYTIALAIMIVSSAPVGINTAIFAELYGIENRRAVVEIGISTLLAVITMPLIIGLVTLIW